MTTKCTGLMGRIFGHKFVPVITKGVTQMPAKFTRWDFTECSDWLKMAENYRSQTFECLMCQRCGAVAGEKK